MLHDINDWLRSASLGLPELDGYVLSTLVRALPKISVQPHVAHLIIEKIRSISGGLARDGMVTTQGYHMRQRYLRNAEALRSALLAAEMEFHVRARREGRQLPWPVPLAPRLADDPLLANKGSLRAVRANKGNTMDVQSLGRILRSYALHNDTPAARSAYAAFLEEMARLESKTDPADFASSVSLYKLQQQALIIVFSLALSNKDLGLAVDVVLSTIGQLGGSSVPPRVVRRLLAAASASSFHSPQEGVPHPASQGPTSAWPTLRNAMQAARKWAKSQVDTPFDRSDPSLPGLYRRKILRSVLDYRAGPPKLIEATILMSGDAAAGRNAHSTASYSVKAIKNLLETFYQLNTRIKPSNFWQILSEVTSPADQANFSLTLAERDVVDRLLHSYYARKLQPHSERPTTRKSVRQSYSARKWWSSRSSLSSVRQE